MATINIGNLTFTHRGDYAGGTAYAKNDVVYYATNGNAYIAKQATTGNAPTNATYWSQFAQGSGGIWNAGLALGSASQKLRVNSSGNALEFFTEPAVTSDFVKIGTVETTTEVASVDIQGCFSTSYDFYTIKFGMLDGTGNYWFEPAWLDSSNNVDTTTMQHKHYEIYGDATSLSNGTNRQADTDGWRIMNTWYQNDNYFWAGGSIEVYDPLLTHMPRHMWYDEMTWSYGNGGGSHIGKEWGMGYQSSTTAHHGIRFRMNGGNIRAGFRATVYGMKN